MRNDYDRTYVEYWAKKPGIEELLSKSFAMLNGKYVKGFDL
ncbi:MAG TPA: hypothetical protein VF556_08825 [Pyrinomonadaceae bacterium]